MSKLTTEVAKQYILHGEAEALRGMLKCLARIEDRYIDSEEEEDIQELRYAYEDICGEIEAVYRTVEARLNKIEELVKNSG